MQTRGTILHTCVFVSCVLVTQPAAVSPCSVPCCLEAVMYMDTISVYPHVYISGVSNDNVHLSGAQQRRALT